MGVIQAQYYRELENQRTITNETNEKREKHNKVFSRSGPISFFGGLRIFTLQKFSYNQNVFAETDVYFESDSKRPNNTIVYDFGYNRYKNQISHTTFI